MARQTGAEEAKRVNDYLSRLFSRSIRTALLKGLEAAVRATHQDSSQAAAHWMLAGESGKTSRPWARKLGKLQYLRGSAARAPVMPVGYRRDRGKNADRTIKFVSSRELKEVVDQLVAGRNPEFRFYLYNAVGDIEPYSANARIEAAGAEGVSVTIAYAEKQILLNNTRKSQLR